MPYEVIFRITDDYQQWATSEHSMTLGDYPAPGQMVPIGHRQYQIVETYSGMPVRARLTATDVDDYDYTMADLQHDIAEGSVAELVAVTTTTMTPVAVPHWVDVNGFCTMHGMWYDDCPC